MILLDGDEEFYQRALQVSIEPVRWKVLQRLGIELWVRRDDQLDTEMSGNKAYKLFFNLQAARAAGLAQVASFGGPWSNHLHALAAAGKGYGLRTIGLVRGQRPAVLSATLQDAEAWGMSLCFLPRETYRHQTDNFFADYLRREYGDAHLIPEGGANPAGSRGACVIGRAIEQQLNGGYQQVCVPSGTGTTLAGVAAGLPANKVAVGFSVLKGAGNLGATIASAYRGARWPDSPDAAVKAGNWRLVSGFHGGGYGKKLPQNLLTFWREFELETGLLLDPVYTLKMFWGIASLAHQGYWKKGSLLVAVHTGGLQGRRGFAGQINW